LLERHGQEALDGGERGAQLVRDDGDEVALDLFDFAVFGGVADDGDAGGDAAGVVEDRRVADFGPDAAAGAVFDELLALGDGDAFARTRSMGVMMAPALSGPMVLKILPKGLPMASAAWYWVIWVEAGLKPTMVPVRSKMTIPSSVKRKTASQRSRRALTSW
jgi:hypothetical protein